MSVSFLFTQQEGALCAQHCLNALLQGPYYTAVDLADLAKQLDEAERQRMSEGNDPNSEEYRRFMAQPSANMDDTGFFSVQVFPFNFNIVSISVNVPVYVSLQVISKAIAVWGLELLSFTSSDPAAVAAKGNPVYVGLLLSYFPMNSFILCFFAGVRVPSFATTGNIG